MQNKYLKLIDWEKFSQIEVGDDYEYVEDLLDDIEDYMKPEFYEIVVDTLGTDQEKTSALVTLATVLHDFYMQHLFVSQEDQELDHLNQEEAERLYNSDKL